MDNHTDKNKDVEEVIEQAIKVDSDKLFAYNLSERIRKGVYEKFENSLKVTMSLGISSCPIDGETYEELVKSADKALYIAKEKGKNQVFSKMPED